MPVQSQSIMSELISLCTLENLLIMRGIYKSFGPAHYLGYNTLDNFIMWHKKGVAELKHLRIYSLSEQSWCERGLYLIVHQYQLFVNSTLPNDPDLAKALQLFDWSSPYKITSVPQQQYETVTRTLDELNINWWSAGMNVYRLSADEVLKHSHNVPANLTTRPLCLSDAEAVNMAWPSNQTGSLQFIKCLISNNPSLGVFCENTKKLVAWCTRCQCGFLGTLHVQPSHRRQGIASLVVDTLAKRIVAVNHQDIFALAYEQNTVSNELFTKLKYKLMDKVYHIRAGNFK